MIQLVYPYRMKVFCVPIGNSSNSDVAAHIADLFRTIHARCIMYPGKFMSEIFRTIHVRDIPDSSCQLCLQEGLYVSGLLRTSHRCVHVCLPHAH